MFRSIEPRDPRRPYDLGNVRLPENFELTIMFGSHVTADDHGDREDFRRCFEPADIVLLEAHGWTPQHQRELDHLSFGDQRVKSELLTKNLTSPFQGFNNVMIEALFGSRKVAVNFDFPASEPGWDEIKEIFSLPAVFGVTDEDFDASLERFSNTFRRLAKSSVQREEYVIARLAPVVEELVATRPQLQRRLDEVGFLKGVMMWGAAHEDIFHGWAAVKAASGPESFRVDAFHTRTYEPGPNTVMVNGYANEGGVDELFLARAMLQFLLIEWRVNLYPDLADRPRMMESIKRQTEKYDLAQVRQKYAELMARRRI